MVIYTFTYLDQIFFFGNFANTDIGFVDLRLWWKFQIIVLFFAIDGKADKMKKMSWLYMTKKRKFASFSNTLSIRKIKCIL